MAKVRGSSHGSQDIFKEKENKQNATLKRVSLREIKPNGLVRQERFFGEKMAYDYLANNDFDPSRAWSDARQHRNTYKGLREDDRNAEHYLYALMTVMNGDEPAWRMQTANAMYCVAKNDTNIIMGDKSPWRETTCTADELKAGHLGARDGKNFTREDLLNNVATLEQGQKADEIKIKEGLIQDNDNSIKM